MQRWKPKSGVPKLVLLGKKNLRPPETTEEQYETSRHGNVYPILPLGKCQSWILIVVSCQRQRGRSYLVTQIKEKFNIMLKLAQVYFPGFKQSWSRFETTTSSVIIMWAGQVTCPCALMHVIPHLERGDIILAASTYHRPVVKRFCVACWSLRKDFPATSDPCLWAPCPNIRRDKTD